MKRTMCLAAAAVLLIYAVGCTGSRQVQKIQSATLEDEALRYSSRFQRNFSLARYSLALDDILQAEAIFDALDMDRERAVSLNNAGVVLERLEKNSEAEAAYGKSLSLGRSAGDTRTVVAALNNLAGIMVGEDPEKAMEFAREAEKISLKNGWSAAQAKAVHTMAILAMNSRDSGKAEELANQALDLAVKGGSKGTESASLVTLSRITAGSGEFESAMELIQKAISIDRDREDPFSIARDYEAMSYVQEKRGDMDGARESREKAERIMEFLGLEEK